MSSWGFGSPVHGTANVGTATTSVLAANSSRKYGLITNDGTGVVYLRLGTAAAVLREGIRLNAGSSFEMSRGAATLYTGPVQGISDAASKLLVTQGQ